MNYQQVIDFWFSTDTQPFWFAKSDAFDQILPLIFLNKQIFLSKINGFQITSIKTPVTVHCY